LAHVEDAELLQDSGVGVVIVFGVVAFRKSDGLAVDEADEGEAEDPVGHVADHVVEVGEHVQWSGASETNILEAQYGLYQLRGGP